RCPQRPCASYMGQEHVRRPWSSCCTRTQRPAPASTSTWPRGDQRQWPVLWFFSIVVSLLFRLFRTRGGFLLVGRSRSRSTRAPSVRPLEHILDSKYLSTGTRRTLGRNVTKPVGGVSGGGAGSPAGAAGAPRPP